MRVLNILMAGMVALAPMVSAASAAAQTLPPPAPAEELARGIELDYDTFTLDNGLRVVVHTDRKAPVVAVQAWYNVGSKDEPEGQTGFAHLSEHIGLFNGTENLPGGLMEPLRALGATDWNGTTWYDRTNFFQTVPTAALEQALYMESDRMGHLLGALTQERLDNQRGVVQNEKRQGDNNPYGLVFYSMLDALFPEGHPYAHSTIGSMADLDAASLQDLRDWHRDNYGPNNAVLVLAGDIDVETARTLVERYFAHIPRGPQNHPAEADIPTLDERVDLTLRDRVSNTRLYRTWVVPGLLDASAAELDVAATVLGGLASSRLDNELVRSDETAVSVTGGVQSFHRLGFFQVTVDVKPGEDVDAVSQRLDQIIADFIVNGPTEDEVQRVVTTALSQQMQALEPTGGFGGQSVVLAEGMLYADDPGFYRQQLRELSEVTPASVREAMGRWLTRPVLAIRVDPGEREPYVEAASERPAPEPVEPLTVTPRGPIPPVGELTPLDFPAVERARLSNGLEVVYARSAAVPVTRVALEFDAGLAADPAEALGTHRLMLNLLTEATETRDAVELAEAEERLGATIGTQSSMDRTALMLVTPSANLTPSLMLLADIAMNPAFAPDEIERLRAQQLAAIAAELTQPNGLGLRALPPLLYGTSHPYGRPFTGTGDAVAVAGIDREDLVAFHQAWIRPDNAQLFVVSDRPLAEITAALEAAFAGWTAPPTPRGVKDFTAPIDSGQPRIVLIDRPQSPQSVILGASVMPVTGQDDLLALNAANEVIGNGFLSRINQDIRETRGWSYGLRGIVNTLENQTPYIITAPVQADRTGESIAVLLDQYRRFASTDGVTEAELTRTINGNVRQLPGGFETSAAILGALRSNALYGRPDTYWEEVAPRYQAMTASGLDQAARAVIDPNRFVWVVVGDASVVRPQLEVLGLPVEVRPAQ